MSRRGRRHSPAGKRDCPAPAGVSRREFLKYSLYGGLAASLPVPLTACGDGDGGARLPSIFLIIVDTLRPDHLGCYGYGRSTSPAIDRFAADATLFTNCRSHAPATLASCASILSGFLPHETKTFANPVLSNDFPVLPELLTPLGYRTAAVISNYLLQKRLGWDRGFELYDHELNDRELVRRVPERLAEDTTARALEVMDGLGDDPLFMWIHYQDPHGPYTPPPPYGEIFDPGNPGPRPLRLNKTVSGQGGIPFYQQLGRNRDYHHYVSQYDGEIGYCDEHFGRLVDSLRRRGTFDESIVIVTSDHGEGMGEHDYFFAHGGNLHGSLTRVPLIVKHPDLPAGIREDLVQHADLLPTLLGGLGLPLDDRLRGRDLKVEVTGKEVFAVNESSWVKGDMDCSLIHDGFKVIYRAYPEGYRGHAYQLYDLASDPTEASDLAADGRFRARAEDLKQRLWKNRRHDGLGIVPDPLPGETREEERRKLESLGYTR